jgi:hypothetical protein
MEFVFVNDWYIYWFATLTMTIYTLTTFLITVGVVFVSAVVYDIVKQIITKWKKK